MELKSLTDEQLRTLWEQKKKELSAAQYEKQKALEALNAEKTEVVDAVIKHIHDIDMEITNRIKIPD